MDQSVDFSGTNNTLMPSLSLGMGLNHPAGLPLPQFSSAAHAQQVHTPPAGQRGGSIRHSVLHVGVGPSAVTPLPGRPSAEQQAVLQQAQMAQVSLAVILLSSLSSSDLVMQLRFGANYS